MCAEQYNVTRNTIYYIERTIPELYSIESNCTDVYTLDAILDNYKWIIESMITNALE
jgi:hypothetical protein